MSTAEFDKLDASAITDAKLLAKDAAERHGAAITAWRRTHTPDRRRSIAAQQQRLRSLASTGTEDDLALALLDATIDGSAFGNPDLVTPSVAFGPLGELAAIVTELTRNYPWTVGDATMFVLTSRTPPVGWMSFRSRHWTTHPRARRVVMVVDPEPAGTTSSVARLIASAYRSRHGYRGTELQRLVVEFLDTHPDTSSWPELCEEWNRLHPAHRKLRENIKRDCERAWNRLRPGEPMPQPSTDHPATQARRHGTLRPN